MESERRKDFDAVYKKYRNQIFQTALMNIRNPDDAEDIAQEALMRYYIHRAHSEVENPKSWLLVTAKNLAYNHVKRTRRERLLHEDEDIVSMLGREPDPEDIFFENMWKKEVLEYTDKILAAVLERNKKWYDVLIYAHGMEIPRQELADSMDTTVDALASMLQRARNWIRENYRDEFDHITRA